MKNFVNPDRSIWSEIMARPIIMDKKLEPVVAEILETVKKDGDEALRYYSEQFDKVQIDEIQLDRAAILQSENEISSSLKEAIDIAHKNISIFHEAQKEPVTKITTSPGVTCWRKSVPIEKVGLYIPGGSAPLFSTVLMLGIPAQIAGCHEVIICTPPNQKGGIHPAIIYTASRIGIDKIFKVGGAQAIGAMAYGTASIPQVDKIFGPGNQFVTKAKQMVNLSGISIDMPAGPSEVMVICDEGSSAEFVAADLLSQAEHGIDSQVILIAPSQEKYNEVVQQLEQQLTLLPRRDIATIAIEKSVGIVEDNFERIVNMINTYAPEHLILNHDNSKDIAEKVINAGSIFLGPYSAESLGDYASGTNHTLPTNGFARMYSGVSLDSFVKKITYQEVTAEGLKNIGKAVEIMAEAEELIAHKNAISIRLESLKK